ncbi:MAG TPA: SPASM domain-containing protein [Candidatus Pacearchaeota archaeon]|nr:SPASM domain-containing protein [Candidatus Pacearchaeota archaeon]
MMIFRSSTKEQIAEQGPATLEKTVAGTKILQFLFFEVVIMIKWSMFNFFIDDGAYLIIKNTLTASVVRISKKLKNELDSSLLLINYEHLFNLKDPTRQDLIVKKLLEKGLLVDYAINEKQKYKKLFLNYRKKDTVFAIYLATTTDCQLDCPYCFEGREKKKDYMSIKEADDIVRWTSKYLDQNICSKLRVVLYGGEPLLNKKIIKYILPKFKDISDKNFITLEVGILTNGEFLNFEMGKFLNAYNLDKVQITIDGPEKVHDSRRFRKKTKRGTFQKIINNIICLLENNFVSRVDIRINFDIQNINRIPELFDVLKSKGVGDKVNLSFGIITPTIPTGQRSYFKENGLKQVDNAEKYIWLCSEAKKRNLRIPKEFLAGPWCMARKIHSAVVLPKGGILKCISLVGRDKFIFNDIYNHVNLIDKRFTNFKYIDYCLNSNCPFVPICGGGCRFEAYLSTGSFSKPHCQKQLIENINKGLIILNYK